MAQESTTHNCRKCSNFEKFQEDEMGEIWSFYCNARPGLPNLRSFPFKHTTCKDFAEREQVKS